MRRHGLIASAADLGLHGHACWTYATDAALIAGASAFLQDGRRLGQRLVYVGPPPPARLLGHLRDVRVLGLDALYRVGAPTDAQAMLDAYAAATHEALADGFTGLRVVAEVTELALTAGDREAHARWEALADRFMARHPLAALCCYDRRRVPADVLGDLCAVHPAARAPTPEVPFQVFARGPGLAVAGEIDFFSAPALERVLALAAGAEVEVDVAGVRFADHHAARVLAGRRLRNPSPELRRAGEIIGVVL